MLERYEHDVTVENILKPAKRKGKKNPTEDPEPQVSWVSQTSIYYIVMKHFQKIENKMKQNYLETCRKDC